MKIEDGEIRLDLIEIMESLSEDDCKMFIKHFSCQSFIIEKVIDYICGDDEDGWWTGDATNIRQKILCRIEKKQLEQSYLSYSWEPWAELTNRLKEIKERKHIYWHLYHDFPDHHEIWEWMKRRGIDSEYTTKQAHEDIKKIESMILDTLSGMSKS